VFLTPKNCVRTLLLLMWPDLLKRRNAGMPCKISVKSMVFRQPLYITCRACEKTASPAALFRVVNTAGFASSAEVAEGYGGWKPADEHTLNIAQPSPSASAGLPAGALAKAGAPTGTKYPGFSPGYFIVPASNAAGWRDAVFSNTYERASGVFCVPPACRD
jgi:hypothetical protein